MSAATLHPASAHRPWIGLKSFSEDDREFFAGRSEEIDELLRLVRRDTLTLLYCVSGLGKTSLVRAGSSRASEGRLPPFNPAGLPRRRASARGASAGAIAAAASAAGVEAPKPREHETLWEYFHRESNHFWSARNELVTPFLVFDQFEEAFTLGRETPVRARRASQFIAELADLVENRPTEALRDDPQRAGDFSFKPALLKVLLAMREDYLAELDRIRSQFRALGQNRLRLLPMGEGQAHRVINLGAPLLAPGVADRIVTFTAGGAAPTHGSEVAVAPALLSLVLRELNERRLARGPDAKITPDLLAVEQQKILEDFYLRTLEDFPAGVRNFIEDELLTATGYRNSCALDDALASEDVTQPILDELVNRRLWPTKTAIACVAWRSRTTSRTRHQDQPRYPGYPRCAGGGGTNRSRGPREGGRCAESPDYAPCIRGAAWLRAAPSVRFRWSATGTWIPVAEHDLQGAAERAASVSRFRKDQ
jgi:hypothetical protein